MVIGGSDKTNTYGHRFIQATGGVIGYGIIGGNNAYNGENSTLDGNALIYVGGNTIVGDDNYIASKLSMYGIEPGTIFASGNGNSLIWQDVKK